MKSSFVTRRFSWCRNIYYASAAAAGSGREVCTFTRSMTQVKFSVFCDAEDDHSSNQIM